MYFMQLWDRVPPSNQLSVLGTTDHSIDSVCHLYDKIKTPQIFGPFDVAWRWLSSITIHYIKNGSVQPVFTNQSNPGMQRQTVGCNFIEQKIAIGDIHLQEQVGYPGYRARDALRVFVV